VNKIRMISAGALGLAVVVLIYLIASSGSGGGYIVRAEFSDADGLRKDSSVKIAGVTAGTVSSVTVTPRDTALATFTLDSNAAPIGAGASVEIRPTDLLGEHYAQLNVGDLSKPEPSGMLIPIQRTSEPVELDDILNMFDVDTRTRLRILINEMGVALAGRGADFNTLLSELPPNINQAQILLGQVASENVTLQKLIDEGDRITAAVNGKRDDLGNLITVASDALGEVASRQAQLGATIAGAPGALTQLRTTLDQVGTAAGAITPAAVNLQAAAGPLTTTLRALPPFANSADATLVTARQVAPDLERLGRQGQSPLKALRPTALDLQSVTKQAAPILTELDQRAMRDLLYFVQNWALALKGRDALGSFVGAEVNVDPAVIQSALDALVNNPSLALDRKGPTRSSTPSRGVASLPGSVTSAAGAAGQGVGKAVAPVLGGVSKTVTKVKQIVGAVTGGGTSGQQGASPPSSSSPNNLQHLLSYLLGQ
jgi:phospholipid/cholesterol/gamma-HCH transport system substrate-binding protein